MTDTPRDPALHDEDRLPWLEAVDDEDDETVSWGKMAGFIVAALLALGIVIGGVYLLRQNGPAPVAEPAKDPKLIAAQEGDYKVPPPNPGGMKVEGKGDSAFATSAGTEANGKINLNGLPETPVKGTKTATIPVKAIPAPAPARVASIAVPKAGAPLVAKPPVTVTPKHPLTGKLVQLGAFGSEAKANQAWATLSKKFSYLSTLPKSVEQARVGGSTVYRLRAAAGDQASSICSKLTAAGENCLPIG